MTHKKMNYIEALLLNVDGVDLGKAVQILEALDFVGALKEPKKPAHWYLTKVPFGMRPEVYFSK